jgi:hypothetical protein
MRAEQPPQNFQEHPMTNLTRTQKLSIWSALFAAVYFMTVITPDLNAFGGAVMTVAWVGMVGFALWAARVYGKTINS